MKLMSNVIGRRALIIAILGGSLLLAFQNCGKAGFDSQSSTDQSDNPNSATAIEKAAPFAFKAGFDTIAYNSCFGSSLKSKSPFFTIRAGAYENTGVHVSKEFMDYAKSNLKPSYPNNTLTVDQVTLLLAKSPINTEAQLQYAIRSSGNLVEAGGVYRQTQGGPTLGMDYFNILGPLTDTRWSLDLVNPGMNTTDEPNYIQYFKLGPRGFRNLEINHSWNSDEGIAQSIRNAFQSDALMTITYADAAAGSARSPNSNDFTKSYGVGYRLNFGVELPPFQQQCIPVYDSTTGAYTQCQATNGVYDTNPNLTPDGLNPANIVSGIQEVDLSTGQLASATWTCDQTMRLMIVRPADQAALCPKGEDAVNLANGSFASPSLYYRDLERIRRVLPADQWDINLTRRCVVPKDGDCYSQEKLNNVLIPVQYDISKTCFQSLDIPYSTTPVNWCAQFVSVCTRQ